MKSPFRVESVSVLDRNDGSSFTFLVFGHEPSQGGHPCGLSLSQALIGTKTLLAPSLVFGAQPSRWGHPYRVVLRISTHSIGTKASSSTYP